MHPEATAASGELRDARGYRRAATNLPGANRGRTPGNKGRRYARTPPSVAEILSFLAACPDDVYGRRLKTLIVFLWRTGVRISEALAIYEEDLTPPKGGRPGSVFIRRSAKSGRVPKSRTVGMDPWAWELLQPWLEERHDYPAGPVFCVLAGPTGGWRAWGASEARAQIRETSERAGLRRRMNPHAYRHLLAVEWLRERQLLVHIKNQLGHQSLRTTDIYLSGIDPHEILDVAANRSAPMVPLNAALELARR